MKKLFLLICMVLLLVFAAGTGFAGPVSSSNVILIDTTDDVDDKVTLEILSYDFSGSYSFGYLDGGVFKLLTPGVHSDFTGGTIFDFAIKDSDTSDTIYSLGKGNGHVTYSKVPNTGTVQKPSGWSNPWYNDISIGWTDSSDEQIGRVDIVNTGQNADGLAPVPIPSAAFLFLSGILGLVGIQRRFIK